MVVWYTLRMKNRKKMIVANWKMNVTSEKDAVGLFNSIKTVVSKLDYTKMVKKIS